MEDDRLIGAKHRAGGDAEQQRVSNLTGSASHRDSNGSVHLSSEQFGSRISISATIGKPGTLLAPAAKTRTTLKFTTIRAHVDPVRENGGARVRRADPEFAVFSFKFEAAAGLES
jgi:hypothetical protein